MTAEQYNWVQSVYFISYILFEVPSNMMLKRVTPRNWQTRIIVSCTCPFSPPPPFFLGDDLTDKRLFVGGIVLACHGAIQNAAGYYAARFFLGVMEAGMFPGFAAQLCSWWVSYIQTCFPPHLIFFICFTRVLFSCLLFHGVSFHRLHGFCHSRINAKKATTDAAPFR